MTRRLLAPLVALSLAACAAETSPSPQLEAQLEGRLERDPTVPGGWIGVETLTVVGADGATLCEDEVGVLAIELAPCEDCSVTVEVEADPVAARCVLADGDTVQRADARVLGFVATSSLGPALTGWIESAATVEGPWEAFSEGLLDAEALAWHHEVTLVHTAVSDLEGGPVSTPSEPPL